MQWVYHANSQSVSSLAVQADTAGYNGDRNQGHGKRQTFLWLLNEALRKVASSDSAAFDPIGWCHNMTAANLARILWFLEMMPKLNCVHFTQKTTEI